MAGWPEDWDRRFAEAGVIQSEVTPSLEGDARVKALVRLSEDVFSKVNSIETSEEQYLAICEEFYKGGKIYKLIKKLERIESAKFFGFAAHKELPQDALSQVRRQLIPLDDTTSFNLYPPHFSQNLKACSALLLACNMDPEIAHHFGPKSLGGSFGAKLHYIIQNVPTMDKVELTAQEIIRLKNDKGIEALQAKKAFIIKCPSEETQREGIAPHQEVCREEWAYALQEILGVSFGVPPTTCEWMPFGDDLRWCSIQEFISGATEFDGKPDDFYSSMPLQEVHKLVFDIIILSTDRAFRNLMTDPLKSIHLIDNGLSFPTPSDEGLREGQFQWMSLPQTSEPITSPAIVSKLKSLNIDKVLEDFNEQTKQIALKSNGCSEPIDQKTQDLIHFTLLLVRKGIDLQVPMKNIAATMVPIRSKSLNKLLGGEVVTFMKGIQRIREELGEVPWKSIESDIEQVLVSKIEDRLKHGRGLFLADWLDTISEDQSGVD